MDYDTVEGIKEYLVNLKGLRRLAHDRAEAHYKRDKMLQEFLILGRFNLDSCGNFSVCEFKHGTDYKVSMDWLHEALPVVLPWQQLFDLLSKVSIHATMFRLPGPESVCDECGEGWTLKNAHDAVPHGEDHTNFRHAECHRLHVAREAMHEFQNISDQAGLGNMLLTPIKNEYWGDDPVWATPWILMRTPKGSIKMGWRKRVISIDWSDVVAFHCKELKDFKDHEAKEAIEKSFLAKTLFPDEDVTKDEFLIHAWGYGKLLEYLTKLSSVAKIGSYARNKVGV